MNMNLQNIDINKVMEVMNLIKTSNMSPKELFYLKAKQMGVDPDEILKLLK